MYARAFINEDSSPIVLRNALKKWYVPIFWKKERGWQDLGFLILFGFQNLELLWVTTYVLLPLWENIVFVLIFTFEWAVLIPKMKELLGIWFPSERKA